MFAHHLKRFDVLLAVCPTQAQALKRRAPETTVATVYQPVDAVHSEHWPARAEARRLLGIDAERLVALPSRVVFQHKGQDVAVRIASRLRQGGAQVHWVVLGDGPDLGRLVDLVHKANLEDRFHFLGWRQDIQAILTAFDAVALPSRFEGLPLVAVEAAVAGVPVIAYAVDGLIDLLDPPFVVSPGDEAKFGATLLQVLMDPGRWPREAQKRKAASLCDPDAVADRVLHALRSGTAKRTRGTV